MDMERARDGGGNRVVGRARWQGACDVGCSLLVSCRHRVTFAARASIAAQHRGGLSMDWCKEVGDWIRRNIEQPIEKFLQDLYQSCTEAREWVEREVRAPIE